jgi:hypothetical protein
VSDALVESIRRQAAGGGKVLPEFEVEIRDPAGQLVAHVHKTVYVRLKPRYRPLDPNRALTPNSGSEPD